MTDFNTWNESLIEAVRKSSLFENGGEEAGVSLCSRCLEIISALVIVLTLPNKMEDYQNRVEQVIEHIKAGRFNEVRLGDAFWWDETPQNYEWWQKESDFIKSKRTSS